MVDASLAGLQTENYGTVVPNFPSEAPSPADAALYSIRTLSDAEHPMTPSLSAFVLLSSILTSGTLHVTFFGLYELVQACTSFIEQKI